MVSLKEAAAVWRGQVGIMTSSVGPLIALTLGDIAGIGPEIVAKVLVAGLEGNCRLLVVDDAEILRFSFQALGACFDLPVSCDIEEVTSGGFPAAMLDLAHADKGLLALGRPHPESGRMAAEALSKALRLAMDGKVDGVVYSPLCKDTLDIGGGEHGDELYLLRRVANTPGMARIVKVGDVLRTSVTGHVPFRDVSDLVTPDSVLDTIEVLQEALVSYGLISPRIGVAALNPHGGESGQIGREEIEQIGPAVQAARSKGIDAQGPFPADTIYVRAFRGDLDGVVNMYHDQGNIAAKAVSFGEGVVLYVRSPVVVTSVGHGTAFDIAGKGVADPGNLRQALAVAALLAERRRGD